MGPSHLGNPSYIRTFHNSKTANETSPSTYSIVSERKEDGDRGQRHDDYDYNRHDIDQPFRVYSYEVENGKTLIGYSKTGEKYKCSGSHDADSTWAEWHSYRVCDQDHPESQNEGEQKKTGVNTCK
ncbi:hypothetical protein BGZ83_008351 [Gryganskiella cystojenkinii]|nr:hypothetical protein BGZ83_008351 [Gryganskiella cystojenkinii]